ncbi:MAG: hypothetical protein CMB99_16265 [Flavobacteriaceae bacterium]|nr:hypothetical protein [Flavobacteriaceae bacterium]
MKFPTFTPYLIKKEKLEDLLESLTNQRLLENQLTPRHKTQRESWGFMPYHLDDQENTESFLLDLGNIKAFRIGKEAALVTSKAIALAVEREKDEFKKKHNIDELDQEAAWRIHDNVLARLIENAGSEVESWTGWIDTEHHLLIMGATGTLADKLTDELRAAVERLPVALITTEKDPSEMLTQWMLNDGRTEQEHQSPLGDTVPLVSIQEKLKFKSLSGPGEPSTTISINGDYPPEIVETLLGHSYTLHQAEITVAGMCKLNLNDKWSISGYEFDRGRFLDIKQETDPTAEISLDVAGSLLLLADNIYETLNHLIELHQGIKEPKFSKEKKIDDDKQIGLELDDAQAMLDSVQENTEFIVNGTKLAELTRQYDENGNETVFFDPLTADARDLIAAHQKASPSFLQRKLIIGYNRAARLLEFAEAVGWITPPDHKGRRTVNLAHPDPVREYQKTEAEKALAEAQQEEGAE